MATYCGTLKSARCSRAKARSSAGSMVAPGPRDDDGAHLLAHHGVGHPDDGDLAHRGMRRQGVLHLDAVHVLAAAIDHVLLAVDDEDQALVVDPREVAAVQPAVDERLGGLLGLAPVAAHDVRPADQQFADARLGVGVGEVDVDDGGGKPTESACSAAYSWGR